MADKESREFLPMPWMQVFRRYIFVPNWVQYCRNYEIKGKFVFAFSVTDSSAQITIIFEPKEALRKEIWIENCGPSLTSCCYHSLERDHRIGKHLHSAFFLAQKQLICEFRLSSYLGLSFRNRQNVLCQHYIVIKINFKSLKCYTFWPNQEVIKQNFQ